MRRRAFLQGVGAAALGLGASARPARAAARASARPGPLDPLARAGITVAARFCRYEGSHPVATVDAPLDGRRAARHEVAGATWTCALRAARVKGRADAVELVATFKLAKGHAPEAGVGLALELGAWSRDNYLLLPAACYDGNRFESRHIAYPPLLTEPADIGPNVPTIVSDIPRLNVHAGPSRLQLLACDLATPAAGVYVPAARRGLLVLVDPTTAAGASGFTVEESEDRSRATLVVAAPGVREDVAYATGNTRVRSTDRGAAFRAGDELALRVRVHLFEALDLAALFERFVAVRADLTGPGALVHELPFSAAFKIHEERANQRWVERPGYYAVGGREGAYADWQTGWCGGLMATLPLIAAGGAQSRARSLRNFDFVFDGGQAPSGFFHGVYDGKSWFEDSFSALAAPAPAPPRAPAAAATAPGARPPAYRHARRWHLVRRSADALTFMVKQLALLERQDPGRGARPPPRWTKGVARCAEAFVRLWDRYHQLGQFVNVDTGEIVVGGSTAAALAPAGLALASAYFKNDDFMRVAKAAALHFYDRYVRAGLTCGAPGDALQCPDSESAAALLESFVTLHEQTGERAWIDRAAAAAHQLATWVISYDLHPAGNPRTAGAVFSNAQNRRGSPGYFLLSGDALFRLHRATGERRYLELLRDTVHNLAQYLPRPETLAPQQQPAPVSSRGDGPAGRPRADTGDWLDGAGDLVPAVGAFDVGCMLAYTEIPGVYVQRDARSVFAFDHVDARIGAGGAGRLTVALANPTRADAAVRLLVETAAEAARPLPPGAVLGARVVNVPAGGSVDVDVETVTARD